MSCRSYELPVDFARLNRGSRTCIQSMSSNPRIQARV